MFVRQRTVKYCKRAGRPMSLPSSSPSSLIYFHFPSPLAHSTPFNLCSSAFPYTHYYSLYLPSSSCPLLLCTPFPISLLFPIHSSGPSFTLTPILPLSLPIHRSFRSSHYTPTPNTSIPYTSLVIRLLFGYYGSH